MKGFLGFLAFTLIVGGLQGLVHEVFGTWIPLMGFMRFVYADGYEIYISIALLALGAAAARAAARAPREVKQPRGPAEPHGPEAPHGPNAHAPGQPQDPKAPRGPEEPTHPQQA